jgi:hypothetical protein
MTRLNHERKVPRGYLTKLCHVVDDGGEVGRPVQLDYMQRSGEINNVQKMKHDFKKIFKDAESSRQRYQYRTQSKNAFATYFNENCGGFFTRIISNDPLIFVKMAFQ